MSAASGMDGCNKECVSANAGPYRADTLPPAPRLQAHLTHAELSQSFKSCFHADRSGLLIYNK